MFDTGGAAVKDYTRDVMRAIGGLLNDVDNAISLAGHTDAVQYAGGERGYSNWELSADRANASRRELVAGRHEGEQDPARRRLGIVVAARCRGPFEPDESAYQSRRAQRQDGAADPRVARGADRGDSERSRRRARARPRCSARPRRRPSRSAAPTPSRARRRQTPRRRQASASRSPKPAAIRRNVDAHALNSSAARLPTCAAAPRGRRRRGRAAHWRRSSDERASERDSARRRRLPSAREAQPRSRCSVSPIALTLGQPRRHVRRFGERRTAAARQ